MYSKLVCAALLAGAAQGGHVLVRRDGAHGHSHGGAAAPSGSGYAAPASPSSGYAAAPATSYDAAAPSYETPSSGYGEPSFDSGYGASSYGAEEEPFNISTLIIPLLVIAGLSLLFPTITTVSVRKRRHAEDVNPMTDVVERVNDIYTAVVQSEECMERIACEVGGLAADVGLSQSPALRMAEGFVPSKYKTYYKQFASGKDCHKIKCGTFA